MVDFVVYKVVDLPIKIYSLTLVFVTYLSKSIDSSK